MKPKKNNITTNILFIKNLLLCSLLIIVNFSEAQDLILPRAHSHNDYYRKRPLLDALDHGFCSVEADVWYVNGELLVCHDLDECKPERNLSNLYLTPLFERVKNNNGYVHKKPADFWLLIDFKNDPENTYQALKKTLEPYKQYLTRIESGKKIDSAVTILISGSVPYDTISAEQDRWVFIDGRIHDLERNTPVDLVPWISSPWLSQFSWLGIGEMSERERNKLRNIVTKAHQQGRKVRFWGAPQTELCWEVLYNEGVDLINTDFPDKLATFLKSKVGN